MEACAQIRERLSEIKGLGHPNQYGLFLMDEDPKKGVWLEPGRTLEHYLLRDNVSTQNILLSFRDTAWVTYYSFYHKLARINCFFENDVLIDFFTHGSVKQCRIFCKFLLTST